MKLTKELKLFSEVEAWKQKCSSDAEYAQKVIDLLEIRLDFAKEALSAIVYLALHDAGGIEERAREALEKLKA